MDYTKAELRKIVRDSRASHPVKPLLISSLLESQVFQNAEVVASYFSYGNELDTKEINSAILEAGKILLLPKLLADSSLVFVKWDGSSDSLMENGKIFEPKGDAYSEVIDLMILPALAVDKSGKRLGQGGGSYDRTKSMNVKFRLAAINESELLEKIPSESHDLPVDAVITPSGLINLS